MHFQFSRRCENCILVSCITFLDIYAQVHDKKKYFRKIPYFTLLGLIFKVKCLQDCRTDCGKSGGGLRYIARVMTFCRVHNRTLILTNFNGKFPAKIFISSDWNELSSCFKWRFNTLSNDYKIPNYRVRMATNDLYIALSSAKKRDIIAISTIFFQIVQSNINRFLEFSLRRKNIVYRVFPFVRKNIVELYLSPILYYHCLTDSGNHCLTDSGNQPNR